MRKSRRSTYKPVRGLARGLAVLEAINHAPGGFVRISELAARVGMHRTTVKRLLETLAAEGYVRRSDSDERYVLTMRVRRLADGFTDDEWLGETAAPVLGELLKSVVWPTDIATLDGDAMVIRETTHRFSPLAFHRAIVGMRLPLLLSALGRAYLAHCPRSEREELLRLLRNRGDEEARRAADASYVRAALARARRDGYATNDETWQAGRLVTALAVPIQREGRVLACLSVVYREKAVPTSQAAARFVPRLKAAAAQIAERSTTPRR